MGCYPTLSQNCESSNYSQKKVSKIHSSLHTYFLFYNWVCISCRNFALQLFISFRRYNLRLELLTPYGNSLHSYFSLKNVDFDIFLPSPSPSLPNRMRLALSWIWHVFHYWWRGAKSSGTSTPILSQTATLKPDWKITVSFHPNYKAFSRTTLYSK